MAPCECILRRTLREGEDAAERARKELMVPVAASLGTIAAGICVYALRMWIGWYDYTGECTLTLNKTAGEELGVVWSQFWEESAVKLRQVKDDGAMQEAGDKWGARAFCPAEVKVENLPGRSLVEVNGKSVRTVAQVDEETLAATDVSLKFAELRTNGVFCPIGMAAVWVSLHGPLFYMLKTQFLSVQMCECSGVGIIMGICLMDLWGLLVEGQFPFWPLAIVVLDMLLVFDARKRVSIGLVAWLISWLVCKHIWIFLPLASRNAMMFLAYNFGTFLFSCAPLAVDYYFTRNFATCMKQGIIQMQESVMMASTVAQALVKFDLETAETLVADGAMEGDRDDAPDELKEAFLALLENLKLYKPYLPDSVLRRAEADFADLIDDESSSDKSSANLNVGEDAASAGDTTASPSSIPDVEKKTLSAAATTENKIVGAPAIVAIQSKMGKANADASVDNDRPLDREGTLKKVGTLSRLKQRRDRQSVVSVAQSAVGGRRRASKMSMASVVSHAGLGAGGRGDTMQSMTIAMVQDRRRNTRHSVAPGMKVPTEQTARKKQHQLEAMELKKRQITLINANARGFLRQVTACAHLSTVQEMHAAWVNSAVRACHDARGVCDGFLGDHIHLSLNAAVQCVNHKKAAIVCARQLVKDVKSGNFAQGATEMLPTLQPSIGVAGGGGLCGNFGSAALRKVQALGGVAVWVHVVERCAALWGTDVLTDQKNDCEAFTFRLVDFAVYPKRGTRKPVKLWELVHSMLVVADSALRQASSESGPYDEYNQALDHFYGGRHADAEAMLGFVDVDRLAAEHRTVQHNIVAELRERVGKSDGETPLPKGLSDVGGAFGEGGGVSDDSSHPPDCVCTACTMRQLKQNADAAAAATAKLTAEDKVAQERERDRRLEEKRAERAARKGGKGAGAAAVAPAPPPPAEQQPAAAVPLAPDNGAPNPALFSSKDDCL